jgi:putative spermidine/putrescine transport system permease protein
MRFGAPMSRSVNVLEGRNSDPTPPADRVLGAVRRWRSQHFILLTLVPGLLVMFAMFVWPLVLVVVKSVTDPVLGLDNYRLMLTDSLFVHVLFNTVVSALYTTIGCLLIGYPLAYAVFSAAGRWRSLMLGLILFAYAVGTIPRAFAWVVLLGDGGVINQVLLKLHLTHEPVRLIYNQLGVLIGMIHVMLPLITLILLGTMTRVSPHLVPAARTLGASPLRAFVEVFVPLTRSGVLAASMLIFIYTLGFYVTPAVLGGPRQTTAVMEIQNLALNLGQWGLGAALSTVLALASVIGAVFYVRTTGVTSAALQD